MLLIVPIRKKKKAFHHLAAVIIYLAIVCLLILILDSTFWIQIGGFITAVTLSMLYKITRQEKNLRSRAIKQNGNPGETSDVRRFVKMDRGDVDDELNVLRKAIDADPNDAFSHSALCKAYLYSGRYTMATMEFRKSIHLFMDQGMKGVAVNEYLSLIADYAGFYLESNRELSLIGYMTRMKRWTEAAGAYHHFIRNRSRGSRIGEHTNLVRAVTLLGDIYIGQMDQPEKAVVLYRDILRSERSLPYNQKRILYEKLRETGKIVRARDLIKGRKKKTGPYRI